VIAFNLKRENRYNISINNWALHQHYRNSTMSDNQIFVKPSTEDAHPQDKQHIRLTYVINYYLDREELAYTVLDVLSRYSKYSSDLLDVIQFVIVDDGSPVEFDIPEYALNITWLRITEDIPWNMGGSKNLGVVYAKSDKVLISDLDREFPEHTLRKMTEMGNLGRKFYKVWARDSETKVMGRPHSNTFLISRGRFLKLYGYDEEYAGGYGAEDYRFVKFQKYHGSWQRKLPKKFYCIRRKLMKDGDYVSLKREFTRNTPIDQRKRNELLYWGEESGHSRMFLNFKWDVVFTHNRSSKPNRPAKRYWKHFWIFRTLRGIFC